MCSRRRDVRRYRYRDGADNDADNDAETEERMPHATAARPTARSRSTAAAPGETTPGETAPQEGPTDQVSDFIIATAAAQALRAAPGVVDISPGVFALVATY